MVPSKDPLHRVCTLLLIALILPLHFVAQQASAQEPGLLKYGKVDDLITANALDGVRVSVREVGADTSTRIYSPITTGQWTYEFTLTEQKHYEVRPEAPGKISKSITIDARNITAKHWAGGFGICLDIALLASIPGQDLSAFSAPYAIAKYSRTARGFTFDVPHTKRMRKHTQALLKKTGQKMAPRPRP